VLGTRQEQHSPVFSLQDFLEGDHRVAFLGSQLSNLNTAPTLTIKVVPSCLLCDLSHVPTHEVKVGVSALEPLLYSGPEALGNPFCPDLYTLKVFTPEVSS
jgi:hypothetical protein